MPNRQHPPDLHVEKGTTNDTVTGEKESGTANTLGPEEEKRLVRKIDLQYVAADIYYDIEADSTSLMPLLIISYGLQYLDSKFLTSEMESA